MPAKYPIQFETEGSGSVILDTAGQALGKHKVVYRGADSKWYLADANATTTMPVLGLTLGIIGANLKGEILLSGYVADTGWSWALGGSAGLIYGSATPGELTQTAPPLSTDTAQVVAVAFSLTSLFFNPAGLNVNKITRTITPLTLAMGAVTFACTGEVMTITGDAGGNTVATIMGGVTGQLLILKFVDALVTITDTDAATANTVNLSAAFTSTANDIMTLLFDGTKWLELSRSIN